MVATTEVLDTLKSIGLNLYERKIYVALLAKGVATAAQVSEIATVPRSRSYDILESLAEKGFVIVQPSKPIKYVALKPMDALGRVKENLKRNHNTMVERIDKIQKSTILEELNSIHSEGLSLIQPTDMTGTLKGTQIINRQLNSVFKDAKKSIEILTTEKGLENIFSNHFRVLKKMNKKGVKLKILAPLINTKIVSSFSQIADMKNVKNPSGRIAIIDGESMLMSLTGENVHESQDVALWANSEHAVKSIANPVFIQSSK
jgi:sugar-specific transcriptional regulator TrmB